MRFISILKNKETYIFFSLLILFFLIFVYAQPVETPHGGHPEEEIDIEAGGDCEIVHGGSTNDCSAGKIIHTCGCYYGDSGDHQYPVNGTRCACTGGGTVRMVCCNPTVDTGVKTDPGHYLNEISIKIGNCEVVNTGTCPANKYVHSCGCSGKTARVNQIQDIQATK